MRSTMGTKVLLVALTATFGACALVYTQQARDAEDVLVAAGFQMKPADTPERLADLKTMPALKITKRSKDGHDVYTYADPYSCSCLYVGGDQEYQKYRPLAAQKKIADEQLAAAAAAQDAALDWEMWGGWGPYGYWTEPHGDFGGLEFHGREHFRR